MAANYPKNATYTDSYILDLMYDLSTTGKGFPSDVKLAIWKITWHFSHPDKAVLRYKIYT